MTKEAKVDAGGVKSSAKASNNDTTGKGFTGVWIPAYLYQHTELSASDREALGHNQIAIQWWVCKCQLHCQDSTVNQGAAITTDQ